MAVAGLLLWLAGAIPSEDGFPPDLEVECLELNTVWRVDFDPNRDPKCRVEKVLEQTIGWRWSPRGYMWADWWVWGHYLPVRQKDGCWIVWVQGPSQVLVRVRARHYKVTNTWYDPEVLDRDVFPEEARAGLQPWRIIRGVIRSYMDN